MNPGMRMICSAWFAHIKIPGLSARLLTPCQTHLAVCWTSHISAREFTPRRAMLYVPGHDERKANKIPTLNADCAVLDCEDGVALTKKDEARKTIKKLLETMDFGRTERAVRINSFDSGLAADDLDVVLAAKYLPSTILLPKVESVKHIDWVTNQLQQRLSADKKVNLIIYVESALGLLDLKNICERAIELSRAAPYLLDGIVFGSDDFCGDIGATRTSTAQEVLMARQQVVLVAKAFRIQAIDIVYIDFQDLEGLGKQAVEGAGMGYTGKQVIHPKQVEIVQKAFSPSPEKVAWAKELIQLFEQHQKSGKGAFAYRGAMIDRPLLIQAQNIMKLAEAVKEL